MRLLAGAGCLAASLAVGGPALPAAAPPYAPAPASGEFDRWSSSQGLSQDAVFALAADPRGFVWIGTEGGLDRFDGSRFESVRTQGTAIAGLPNDFIWTLRWGRSGLWIGTNGGGLALYRPGLDRITSWPMLGGSAARRWVLSILEASDGAVWVGTRGAGVLRLRWPGEVSAEAPSVEAFEPGGAGLGSQSVRALAESADGTIWLGGEAGLARLRKGARRIETVPLVSGAASDPHITGLVARGADEIWVSTTTRGLLRISGDTILTVLGDHTSDPALRPWAFFCLTAGADGSLWAGSNHGLVRVDPASGASRFYRAAPDVRTALPADEVVAVLATDDGSVWAGTFNAGVARLDASRSLFTPMRPDPGRPGSMVPNRVRAVLEDRDGAVWVGTFGGGLLRFDPDGARRIYRAAAGSLPSDSVWALHEAAGGGVWAATDAGLVLLRPGTSPAVAVRPPDGAVLRALAYGPDGALWFSGAAGLLRLPPGGSRPERVTLLGRDGRPLADIYALLADPDGTIWVGAWTGLCRLAPAGASRCWDADSSPALPAALVWALHRDRKGRLWAGTSGGLVRVETGPGDAAESDWLVLDDSQGLPSSIVYDILEDDGGGLWLSTSRGLARWHPDEGTIHTFDESDGLASTELSAGAAFRGASGRFYVGGKSGFTSFVPAAVLAHRSPPPRPQLLELRLGDRPVPVAPPPPARQILRRALGSTPRLDLSWSDRVVAFRFTAVEYHSPHRLRFQYLLEGLDAGWRTAREERTATYTSLEAGSYRLRVRVTDVHGRWSPHEASLRVVVTPPWWLAWWFRAGLVAVAGAVLIGGHALRIRTLEARRRALEEVVRERTEALAAKTRELEEKNGALFELSVRDRLTGVFNRGHGVDSLARAVAEATRYGRPFSVILADLDRFKSVNDRFGHAAGDAVLREAAARLSRRVRQSDTISRWGGEELLVLLPETALADAAGLAEALRRALTAAPVAWERESIPLSASFGVATLDAAAGETPEALVHRADLALYRAKQAGRDRVEVAAG